MCHVLGGIRLQRASPPFPVTCVTAPCRVPAQAPAINGWRGMGTMKSRVRVRIRAAAPEERDTLAAFKSASLRCLAVEAYEPAAIEAHIRTRVGNNRATTSLVLESGRRTTAFASWSPGNEGHAAVSDLYVHPMFARKGFSRRLLMALERDAASHGHREIGVSATLNAMPFFSAMGYRPTEILRESDGSLMAVKMHKSLSMRVAVAA
jgi:putative acetyltransferase